MSGTSPSGRPVTAVCPGCDADGISRQWYSSIAEMPRFVDPLYDDAPSDVAGRGGFSALPSYLVAKDVSRKDWMQNSDAKAAVQKEWDRLLQKRTWAMPERPEDVTFLDDVIRKSKASGKQIHLGRLFDICVLKGSELPEGHINRKWKGRVVFGGNNVQEEYGLAAAFPEAGSGASYACASKLLDAVSMFQGHVGEQSDAPAAYTQAEMY